MYFCIPLAWTPTPLPLLQEFVTLNIVLSEALLIDLYLSFQYFTPHTLLKTGDSSTVCSLHQRRNNSSEPNYKIV